MKKLFKKITYFLEPYLAYIIINTLKITMRFTFLNSENIKEIYEKGGNIIMTFWHGRLLMMPVVGRHIGKDKSTLISMHQDGEIISRVMDLFDYSSIRGSTTRGGTKALRDMVKTLRSGCDIVITPDGRKGPRYTAQNVAVVLAKLTGVPICPISFGASKKKQFSSWDGFILPHLFSKGVFIWGEPIYVSKDADKEELERKRIELEESLKDITKKADSYF